jgi:RimJ/RimL family protein N-acetyltransferase
MRPDDWHLTEDVDGFLARAGDFLRSRPALHTMPLTVTEKLRARGAADAYGAEATVFGRLEREGDVRAIFYRLPSHRLTLTSLPPEQADTLAARLADLGRPLSGVTADHDTATAFAEAWQRHTGAAPTLSKRIRLYRLGTLTPPTPCPEGRGRIVSEEDQEQLVRWCAEFVADVGEVPSVDADSWADTRFADKHFTFWEAPDGTPVSMAGSTSPVAGMVRVDPVYTPSHLRGRGYAGAVTVEVSRAALAAGATDVVLFTDPANPTSNALYQRIGYAPVTDFAAYDFSDGAPDGSEAPPRELRHNPPRRRPPPAPGAPSAGPRTG